MSSPVILQLPQIIREDFALLSQAQQPSRGGRTVEQQRDMNTLVGLVVARIFLVAAAVCIAMKGLKLSTLFGLVVCHELFVMSYNQSRMVLAKNSTADFGALIATTIMSNLSSLTQGGSFVHPIAQGTLLQPLWSNLALRAQFGGEQARAERELRALFQR